MSDSITVDVVNNKAATIFVSRKVSVKQYESLEVAAHLPVEIPEFIDGMDAAEHALAVGEALRNGVNLVKVQVYDALGIEYSDEGGIVKERVAAAFAGAATAERAARPTAAPDRTPASSASAPAAEGEKACPKCGGAMWDNRGTPEKPKRNPKAPDHKCKNPSCDGVIWPPRGR